MPRLSPGSHGRDWDPLLRPTRLWDPLERRSALDSAGSSFARVGWGWEKLVDQNGFLYQQKTVEQRGHSLILASRKKSKGCPLKGGKNKNKNKNKHKALSSFQQGNVIFQFPTGEGRHSWRAQPEEDERVPT